jgi:hypothetical protein
MATSMTFGMMSICLSDAVTAPVAPACQRSHATEDRLAVDRQSVSLAKATGYTSTTKRLVDSVDLVKDLYRRKVAWIVKLQILRFRHCLVNALLVFRRITVVLQAAQQQ